MSRRFGSWVLASVAGAVMLFGVSGVAQAAVTFSNPGFITINDGSCAGPATSQPYPATIDVSALSGSISDVNVTLFGFAAR